MFVVEQFTSINGEGTRAGEPAVFVRFRGCNLSCSYCDTKWANTPDAPARDMSPAEIAESVLREGIKNVTLTGGEPMLQPELPELCRLLYEGGCSVEIETNGSVPFGELAGAEYRPIFTADYKLPSSGMEKYMCGENFSLLRKCDTVKFVSGSIEDLERAREIIARHSLCGRCNVYISPVFGGIELTEIVEYMLRHKMNGVRLQLQLHKYIWDPDKRGV